MWIFRKAKKHPTEFREKKLLLVAGLLGLSIFIQNQAVADTQASRPAKTSQAPVPKEHPVMTFPGKAKGAEAFKRLKNSGKLPEWSKFYDVDESSVQAMFERDPTANIDQNGRLHFIEPASTGSGDFSAAQASIPLDQTFFLNSSPGSSKTIYLDFNGHSTSSTAWNQSYGISTIASPAYDLDGVAGTFSSTELNNIQTVWKMVAEDYAGLDVNVTTQEPPVDRMTRSSSTDNTFGVRVVITRDFTSSTSNPCSCGGFAYVGVFSSTSEFYKPAFVFYNNLGNAKNIAEATSHEAGHTLGLSHDGTTTTGYYSGHGTGETGWAPIMGVGYNRNLVQWSKGEYANANQKQDDYFVMQNQGVPFDIDEHGNSPGSASILNGVVVNGLQQFKATGILQGPNDSDYVSFNSNAGSITIDAKPLSTNTGNADLLVTLFDSGGQVLAQSNNSETLGTALSYNASTQGTYILKVEGTGKGDPLATGYTKYGSIGYWSVVINAQVIAGNLPPTARISADRLSGEAPLLVNFSAAGSTDPEGTALSYAWDFGDGTSAIGVSVSKTFQAAGSFPVSLTVTDTSGLSGSATQTISVSAPATQTKMSVAGILMTGVVQKTQRYANATVTIRDANGNVVPGATVAGSWSGIVSGGGSGVTGTNGQIILKSPNAKRGGTITFTVNSVTKTNFVYDPAGNASTTASVTVQ